MKAFTLIELLVAATIGLGVMASLATLLGLFSRTSTSAQAIVNMTHSMRVAGTRLRQDLAGVTAEMSPPLRPEANMGYFELIEGPRSDAYDWVTPGGTQATKATIESFSRPGIAGTYLNATGTAAALDPVGDVDDLLLFTTKSLADPFTGRYGGNTIDSSVAEVAWFLKRPLAQPISGITVFNLYRKQLLVLGYPGAPPFVAGNNSYTISSATPLLDFYRNFDISVRLGEMLSPGTVLYPNTLSDLTKRENRFNRATSFPYPFQSTGTPQATFDSTAREGEDVILRNVIAFDVRVFDAAAPVKQIAGVDVPGVPGDIGYADTSTVYFAAAPGARGAYVDLGWGAEVAGGTQRVTTRLYRFPINPAASPAGFDNWFPGSEDANRNGVLDDGEDADGNGILDVFSPWQGYGMQTARGAVSYGSPNDWGAGFPLPLSYDTWSAHYEANGLDEDGDGVVDQGNNGFDENGDGIPDDPAERETSPPYPVPLRGLEVRIRCIEPTTKEIRQITIRHAFQ